MLNSILKSFILALFLGVVAHAQVSSPRARHDTLLSHNPSRPVFVDDTLRVKWFIDLDSGAATIAAPAYGRGRIVSFGMGGLYVIYPNGGWYRIDSAATGGSGEANTASNTAGAGVGVFKVKSGVDLIFKRLKSLDANLTIADSTDSLAFDFANSPTFAGMTITGLSGTVRASAGVLSATASDTVGLAAALFAKAPKDAPTFTTSVTTPLGAGTVRSSSGGLLSSTASDTVGNAAALFAKAATATTITIAGTADEITSSAGAQDLSANRTWTIGHPDDVTVTDNLSIDDTLTFVNAGASGFMGTLHAAVLGSARDWLLPNASGTFAVSASAPLTLSSGIGALSISLANGSTNGYLSSTDWTTFNGKQASDADLTTIAGLTATTDNFITSVTSAWASRTPAQVRTTLGLVVGTNVQAYDADLTTYAGIPPSANVQTLLGSADYAAFRTNLSLGNVTNESKATMFTSPTFTGTVTIPTPFTLGAVSVLPTGTELNYVDGVTSAIQTQLNTKAPTASPSFTGTVDLPSAGQITVNSAEPARTLILSGAGGAPTTTIGCGGPTKIEAVTNDVDYFALEFDASTEERAFWVVQMPENYSGGTITAKFVWTNAAGATTQGVVWGIKARSYADDEAIDQAYGSEISTTDTWLAQGDVHISVASSIITIGGTPAGGELVVFNVGRKVANAADTMTGDARLIAVRIEYGISSYSD